MGYGESKLVNELNEHFNSNNIQAFAYRNKQSRFSAQMCDVNVDSRLPEYYLAIEVKAKRGKRALNFNDDFTTDIHEVHQLDRLIEYAENTGRIPIVHVVCRMGTGRKPLIYNLCAYELGVMMGCEQRKSVKAEEYKELDIGGLLPIETKRVDDSLERNEELIDRLAKK